jgi:stage II sporulation protein B
VYIKNIELPALTKIKWNGKQPETVQNCLTQGAELVQQISGLTLPHLSEAKPTPLDANALNSIKSAHQTWSSLHSGMHGNLVEEAKTAHQKMSTALNTAIVSLDEYKKNPSASYLWQAQSAMMQYTLADKELREAIAAQ